MLDVLSLAEQDTKLHKESVREQAGPCPNPLCRCQKDGFRVKWNGDKCVFMCRGCWDSSEMLSDEAARKIGKQSGDRRGWGDAIDYLRHYRGLSFREAKRLVNDETDLLEDAPARTPVPAQDDYRSERWQKVTRKGIERYIAAIWSDEGRAALDYVRGRGLSDEVIKQFRLGYSTKDNIPRLLIPCINDGWIYAIYRRDMRPDTNRRWMNADGGTMSELYLADLLKTRKGLPVVLVEDAFSALSIWQEAGDLINPIATGSANCGKLVKWLARLSLAPHVLIALDADEPGDKEAAYWLARLQNASRLRPLLKDANDMLQAGHDLRTWILAALQPETVELATVEAEETQEAWSCAECGIDLYGENTDPYYSDEGIAYCQLHGPQGSSQLPTRASFVEYVTRLASDLETSTGVHWQVMPIEPGYTLEKHVARLAEDERARQRQAFASRRKVKAA